MVFCHIQALVNVTGDGLDFCPQLLFNTFQVEPIIIGDQVDGQAKVAKSTLKGGNGRHETGLQQSLLLASNGSAAQ